MECREASLRVFSATQKVRGDGGKPGDNKEEVIMNRGAQMLLGHWLGNWGAWALNGNGVVAYPHQLRQSIGYILITQGVSVRRRGRLRKRRLLPHCSGCAVHRQSSLARKHAWCTYHKAVVARRRDLRVRERAGR